MSNGIISTIWNGLKRAVKFVVDVLLFIPKKILGFFSSLLERPEAYEEPLEEPDVELIDEALEEQPKAVFESAAASEPYIEKVEFSKEENSKHIESEEVKAEIIDSNGEVLTDTSTKIEKDTESVKMFASSEKEAKYETDMMKNINKAKICFAKYLWADMAIDLKQFAVNYITAVASKENALDGKPYASKEKMCEDLLEVEVIRKVMRAETYEYLKSILSCALFMQDSVAKPRLDKAITLVESYEQKYYPEQYEMLLKKQQQAAKAVA